MSVPSPGDFVDASRRGNEKEFCSKNRNIFLIRDDWQVCLICPSLSEIEKCIRGFYGLDQMLTEESHILVIPPMYNFKTMGKLLKRLNCPLK